LYLSIFGWKGESSTAPSLPHKSRDVQAVEFCLLILTELDITAPSVALIEYRIVAARMLVVHATLLATLAGAVARHIGE
jgi:hypothetical protein